MAILHRATITPSKAELVGAWAPTRPWVGPRPTIGLTATWDGSGGDVVLAEVRER
jgi:hypothetical protein